MHRMVLAGSGVLPGRRRSSENISEGFMKRTRLALSSAAIFGAGLCWLPSISDAATTYTASAPNRPNGTGGQWGEGYNIISNVVLTTGYENIQSASTTIPGNSVQAPALFI